MRHVPSPTRGWPVPGNHLTDTGRAVLRKAMLASREASSGKLDSIKGGALQASGSPVPSKDSGRGSGPPHVPRGPGTFKQFGDHKGVAAGLPLATTVGRGDVTRPGVPRESLAMQCRLLDRDHSGVATGLRMPPATVVTPATRNVPAQPLQAPTGTSCARQSLLAASTGAVRQPAARTGRVQPPPLATPTAFVTKGDVAPRVARQARGLPRRPVRALSRNTVLTMGPPHRPPHRGVTCSECAREPLRGGRWHAMTRPGVDLCDDCIHTPGPHARMSDVWLHLVTPVAADSVVAAAALDDGLPPKRHADHASSSTVRMMRTHVGVRCDGCDQEIVGARFRCANCIDHDLCSGTHRNMGGRARVCACVCVAVGLRDTYKCVHAWPHTACYLDPVLPQRRCPDSTHVFFMFEQPVADVSHLRLPNLYGESWTESRGASFLAVCTV